MSEEEKVAAKRPDLNSSPQATPQLFIIHYPEAPEAAPGDHKERRQQPHSGMDKKYRQRGFRGKLAGHTGTGIENNLFR